MCSSAKGFDQLGGPDVQAVRQLDNIQKADVPLPTLDPAHIVSMQFCQLRELFLREIAFFSQLADTPSEHNPGVGIRHLTILRT
jgi:hypothetical protein